MYFQDLDLCAYSHGPTHFENWHVPLRAVGWLEHPHPYTQGVVPEEVRTRLQTLFEGMSAAFFHHQYLGPHDCSICKAAGMSVRPLYLSPVNIFVPGNGCVYAAPGGIDHYLDAHSYCPPTEFCEGVLNCPNCDSVQYREALRRVNGGPIPLYHAIRIEGNTFRFVPDGEA